MREAAGMNPPTAVTRASVLGYLRCREGTNSDDVPHSPAQADRALADLAADRVNGAAVLRVG